MAWAQESLGSNPRSPTKFCGVAKWQGGWLLTSLRAGSNPAPTAKIPMSRVGQGSLSGESPCPTNRRSRVRFSTPVPSCSLNPAVRYGSDKAGRLGSTPRASTRIKNAPVAEGIYALRFYRRLRGFESSQALHREVVQWQDVGFWSQLRVFDSLPRGQDCCGVIQR